MMSEGLNLMLYGMGTVFVFLTLLVLCTMAMSAVMAKFCQAPDGLSLASSKDTPTNVPDQRLVAVIEAAVAEHRQSHRTK